MSRRSGPARSLALLFFAATTAVTVADDKPTKPSAAVPSTSPAAFDLDFLHQGPSGSGGGSLDSNDPRKYRDFNDLTAGSARHEGLFSLYQKEDHLFAEIKPYQFDQPILAPITIARGLMMAGVPLNFGDEWVLVFHRAGDKVQLIRRNIHVKAPQGTPIEKAVHQNYTDSILMALPIVSIHPAGGMSVVVDLADIFFTNFAQLPLGYLDRSRTNWSKVKAFANNLELEVQATFTGFGGQGMGYGDEGIVDSRGVTVVIHYSLVKLPDFGYHSRIADDRVGHFLNATKDFGATDPEENVTRYVNRWRLEKADPGPSCRLRKSRSSGTSRTRFRSSTGRRSRTASASGTRRSRRSASATPSRSAGRRRTATSSTPRTRITARSAGSPPAAPTPCPASARTRSPAR